MTFNYTKIQFEAERLVTEFGIELTLLAYPRDGVDPENKGYIIGVFTEEQQYATTENSRIKIETIDKLIVPGDSLPDEYFDTGSKYYKWEVVTPFGEHKNLDYGYRKLSPAGKAIIYELTISEAT